MNPDGEEEEPIHLRVAAADAGQRLDLWLHAQRPDLSRARLQALIRSESVLVDGAPARAHLSTRADALVTLAIPPAEPITLRPENIPLDILFEDGDLVVLNKPAGLVVHPAAGHPGGTLVNALLYHCHDLAGVGGELRPGIVHRLDKDTSGVMVVAKHDRALQSLVEQFKNGQVHKTYVALVRGIPHPPARRIESLVGRSRQDRKKMSAQPPRGRTAVTRYEVVETFGGEAARIDVSIETGRTHQIRVQMAHIGHPVLGDSLYGRCKPIRDLGIPPRQMLHARHLSFLHPVRGEPLTFEAPLPADIVEWIELLRGGCEDGTQA